MAIWQTENSVEPGDTRRTNGSAAPHVHKPSAEAHHHAVRFYEDDAFLITTLVDYLRPGIVAQDLILVIATPDHVRAIKNRLEGSEAALRSGQLLFLDAEQTLASFMVGGMPDRKRFLAMVDETFARMKTNRPEPARLRAYGEMVDLLWRTGNRRAAISLEDLWNEAGKRHDFQLLCAYVINNFFHDSGVEGFLDVCRTHSHVYPSETLTPVHNAPGQDTDLLRRRTEALALEIHQREQVEEALRHAVHERTRVEAQMQERFDAEREARRDAEHRERLKDLFIGILGHDLRNPLSAILTGTHLLKKNTSLPPDVTNKIQRLRNSAERMERLIAQLLDLTRIQLGGGIPIRQVKQDLAVLVDHVIHELRIARPNANVVVDSDAPCHAVVDGDRMEQVVSNLVANAMKHGDPERPVTVRLRRRDLNVELSVHNFGPPIPPELFPTLFDPFAGTAPLNSHGDGLGLGLYIAQQILTAHDGKLSVQSSSDAGTCFTATLRAAQNG